MEQFLKATGMRKVFMGVYFHAVNALMLYWKVLPADNFQVITLVLIAGFFGGNIMERKKIDTPISPKEPTV